MGASVEPLNVFSGVVPYPSGLVLCDSESPTVVTDGALLGLFTQFLLRVSVG